MMAFAHLIYNITDLCKSFPIDVPRSDIANLCFRTELTDAGEQDFERVCKHFQGVGIGLAFFCIVVSTDDEYIISIWIHDLVSLPQSGTKIESAVVGTVECYARSVATIVVVFHSKE